MEARRLGGRSAGQGGFALPMSLLVLLVLTGAALAALSQSSVERRLLDSGRAENAAFVLAETGLEQFVTHWEEWGMAASPAVAYDSTRLTFNDGYVDVTLQRVRPASGDDPALYLLRALGVHTLGGWAGAPPARRAITRYGTWVEGVLDVRAAWTSLSGLEKNGAAGTISGADACGVAGSVAGVTVPAVPGYVQNGGDLVPDGAPDIQLLGLNPLGAAAEIEIDWRGIVSGNALVPDFVLPTDGWPSFADPDLWPILYVDNAGQTFSLPGSGRGILIIRGNFTISGGQVWEGIILVGGRMTSVGDNTVEGAVISGLNLKVGEAVAASDAGAGTKTFVYNSCTIASAMREFSGVRLLNNTWFDGWALP